MGGFPNRASLRLQGWQVWLWLTCARLVPNLPSLTSIRQKQAKMLTPTQVAAMHWLEGNQFKSKYLMKVLTSELDTQLPSTCFILANWNDGPVQLCRLFHETLWLCLI